MKQKEEKSTTLIKLIADTFYITFLPEAEDKKEDRKIKDQYLNLLEKYINENGFNRKKFICDAKKFDKNAREIFLSLLPEELIDKDENTLNEIEAAYQNIHKENQKGGYVRAVLAVLYDKKYQQKFNEISYKYLEHVKDLKVNANFSILANYLQFSNHLERGNFSEYQWNISDATKIKAIGSTKDGKTEKVDNPYSAYKVYAQGEYSKLRIGYKADPSLPLNKMLEKGFETTLTDNEKITYKTYRIINKKTKEKKEVIETCDMTPYEYINNYKMPNEELESNDKHYLKLINEWKRNTLIYDLQIEAINKILQRFNNFIPYDLKSKITKEKKDGSISEITIKEEIYNQCKNIFFENRYEKEHLDKLEKYGEGSFLSENEKSFINSYFYCVVDCFRYGGDRRKFDEVTNKKFETSWTLQEKTEALNQLIYSRNIQYHPQKDLYLTQTKTLTDVIEGLKTNSIWQGIVNKFNSDEYKNPSYNNHYTKEGSSYIDDEENALYTQIENVYKKHELSQSAFYLLRLFDEQFHENPDFLSTIYEYIKQLDSTFNLPLAKKDELKAAMHTLLNTKQEKDAFDAYLEEKALKTEESSVSLDEIDDKFFRKEQSDKISEMKKEERIGTLKTHYFMQCLDKNRNYNGLRLIYNNRNGKTGKDDKNEEKLFTHKVRYGIYQKLRTIGY